MTGELTRLRRARIYLVDGADDLALERPPASRDATPVRSGGGDTDLFVIDPRVGDRPTSSPFTDLAPCRLSSVVA